MLRLLKRFWYWLKSLFRRESQSIPASIPRQKPAAIDYENALMAVLDREPATVGALRGILRSRGVREADLARWLAEKGREWLESPENYRELGRKLARLAEVATGELGTVAGELARGLEKEKGNRGIISDLPVGEAETWVKRGSDFLDLKRYTEALDCFERAIQLDPDNFIAWYGRGATLHNNFARYEEAIVSHNRAIELNSDNSAAWYNRGTTLLALRRKEEALASYDKALQLKPDDSRAWYGRGNTLSALGRKEEALASHDKALQLNPDYSMTWHNRGAVLGNLGRKEEAITSSDKALQLNPDFSGAWNNRGIAARVSEYNPRYQREFVDLFQLEITSNLPTLTRSLETSDPEILIRSFDPPLPAEIATSIRQQWRTGIETLKSSLSLSLSPETIRKLQQDSLTNPNFANPLLKLRGYEGEIASYQEGLKHVTADAGKAELHHALGNAHYRQGKKRAAEASYKDALNLLTPDDKIYLTVLADLIRVLLDLGETDEAEHLNREGRAIIERLDLLGNRGIIANSCTGLH